ncbi:MAG: hypothetical protein Q9214_001276 [Letrouitia sp. 1 TL-2023]
MAPPSKDPPTLESLQAQLKHINILATQLTSLKSACRRKDMEVTRNLFERESESVRDFQIKAYAEEFDKRIEKLEKELQENEKRLQSPEKWLKIYDREIEERRRQKDEDVSWVLDFVNFIKDLCANRLRRRTSGQD